MAFAILLIASVVDVGLHVFVAFAHNVGMCDIAAVAFATTKALIH
jgi:hypothetical protein